MLYDPKWEQEVKGPSLIDFIAWLEKQPAETMYPQHIPDRCIMGQYHCSIGVEYPIQLYGWMAEVAFPGEQTFGAALERARAALQPGRS